MSEPLSKVLGLKYKEHTHDCLIYQPTSNKFECMCEAGSYNQCLNDLDQLSPDVEKLAKVLHEARHTIFTKMFPWDEINDTSKLEYRREAQEIINKMSVWIKKV